MNGKGLLATILGVGCALLIALAPPHSARGQENPSTQDFQDFSELSLEDVLNMKVTSATKMEQSVLDSPNAIAVITADDIRRAGALNIPEALRLSPGVYVAQISGNEWVVTIGGFALGAESRQVLILVDGVSVYLTDSGRVDFDTLPVEIDEVAKIEVIRGPGGVLYGANAVTGVISITTFAPGDNPNAAVRILGGSQGTQYAHATGSATSPDGRFSTRASVTTLQDQGLGMHSGQEHLDYQQTQSGSLRNTFNLDDGIRIDLDARFKSGDLGYPAITASLPEYELKTETNIFRGKVEQTLDNGGSWYLQAYSWRLNRSQYNDEGVPDNYVDSTTNDLEFQSVVPFEAAGNHRLSLGGGYRWNDVESVQIKDGEQDETIANAFLHDEWVLSDQWIVNAGVKWEDSSISIPTWQWRGALLYKPVKNHSFRLSAANSYRQPSLSEQYIYIDVPVPADLAFILPFWPAGEPQQLVTVRGNEELEPEQVISYEAEYRGFFAERLFVDLSYSYRQYDNLISFILAEPGFNVMVPTGPPPAPVIPIGPMGSGYSYGGGGEGVSQTAELELDYRVNQQLRLTAIYSYVDIQVDDKSFVGYEVNSPENFGRIGLNYTHPEGFMFDLYGNYVDEVWITSYENANTLPTRIDSYWTIDARIAQRAKMKNGELEVGLVGKNLGEEWNEEYLDYSGSMESMPVRRSFYGYLEYRN